MITNTFEDEEIPYDILTRFGLTHEMIEDLPQKVLTAIRDGRRSPVLPICYTCDDGAKVNDRARFSLFRDPATGQARVMFYPQQTHLTLAMFTEAEQALLREGKPILSTHTTDDGRDQQSFHQLDPATCQVLTISAPVIGNNLQVLADTFHLSSAELNCLRNGEPLTIADDTDEVTYGIDLNAPKGFRHCMGDTRKWQEQADQLMDTYTFGICGCSIKAPDGQLSYIPEDQYTEYLWEAQKQISRSQVPVPRM